VMNTSFLAWRCGAILAAASLALTSSGMTALSATTASSLSSAAESEPIEAAVEPTSSIEPTNLLADSNDGDDADDDENDDDVEVSVESLPKPIAEAVLKEVAQRSGMQMSDLKIIGVARRTWQDGCLGLGGGICTQAQVPGWLVAVASEQQIWAYRTNESGAVVKLDETLSQTLTSRATTEINRTRVETTQTTRTSQTVTGGSSQTSVTAASGSQSGSTSSQSVAVSGSSQSSQMTGSSQMSGGVSTRTQQQMAATSSSYASFTDISQSYWARDFIAELAAREIIDGFPDGKFRPNEPVTRAQFAAMIRKAFKNKKSKIRNAVNFRDVSSSYWAYNSIRECYEMGFLNAASSNLFRPSSNLTRLDILVALTKGLNYTYTGSTDSILRFYSDVNAIPASYRTLIAAATQQGIVVNYPNVKSLSLNTVATRAEVAAFIYQALVSTGEMTAISSPYVVGGEMGTVELNQTGGQTINQTGGGMINQGETEVEGDRNKPRQNCNQGIGNGAEGCDPGNSRPHGGSNDEGGRTPGNRR
ncbi:MAG TPA: S-layer homology domain-containing protein, partial [Coleofasciculaceae cyanobacterium]